MKNYNKADGRPPDSYLYWSENNMTMMKYADSTNAIRTVNFTKYNESGYPTEFTVNNYYSPETTVSCVIEYQCH